MRGSPTSREPKSGAGLHICFARAPDLRSPSSPDSPSPCAILSHGLPDMLRRVSPWNEADARDRRQPVGERRVGCPFPRPSRGDARKGAAHPWAAMCAACRVLGRTPVAPRRRHARPACRATLRHPTFRAPVRRSGCSQHSRPDHLPRTHVASASNQRKTSRSISLSEACALRARSSSSRTSARSTSAPFSPSASRSNTLEVQCLTSSA